MRGARPLLLASGSYLAVSVACWWHVWSGGVGHTITSGGWGDPAQQIWFLAWVPHALANGLDPFVSHAMFAPAGINLMENTSILLPSFVASPLTVLFGPVVSFNVLLTIAPALDATVSFLVFRRYAGYGPGAYIGALFYGFSPFVANDLSGGHLHMTLLWAPPVVLALLDDICLSRRGSPSKRGVLLGLVLAAQALTSLEVLAIVVAVSAAVLVLLALTHPGATRDRLRELCRGLGAAALTAAVLLAYPFYVALDGPRRYSGHVFREPEAYVIWLKALVWPKGVGSALVTTWPSYVGIPLLALVVCWAVLKPSLLGRISLLAIAVAIVLGGGRSLKATPSASTGVPLPDRLISHSSFLGNLLPVRFSIALDLFVGLGVACALSWLRAVFEARSPTAWREESRRLVSGLTATCCGALALVSPALGLSWPQSTRQLVVPRVYASKEIRGLPAGSVLLAYPVLNGFKADQLIWQAESSMCYELVAGYGFVPGPKGRPIGSLPSSPLERIFGDAQLGILPPQLGPGQLAELRRQLQRLGTDDVVLADVGRQPAELARVMTKVIGRPPARLHGAYVWLDSAPLIRRG